MKGGYARCLSWYLALTAVALEFTVSGNLLTNAGIAYISDGGTICEKLHPGTYAVILSGLLKFSSHIHERHAMHRFVAMNRSIYLFLSGMLFCATYTCATNGSGNVIVFLDTFMPAGMLALLLHDITPARQLQLKTLVQSLLVLNATIALTEALTERHLVPVPLQGNDYDKEFRPTALYDHALSGATATMLGLWLTTRHAAPSLKRWVYLGLMAYALLVFGERTPLAAALFAFASCAMLRAGTKLLGRELTLQDVALCVSVPIGVIVLAAAASGQDLGSRLSAHLYWDDSAQVRFNQFGILKQLRWQDFVFGCARTDLLAMIEPLRLSSRVAVIENFWLFTLLALGILVFPVFVASFAALLWWLWRLADSRGRLMIVTFTAVASASNSLGRKSTLLVTLVACVISASPALARPPMRITTGGL